MYQLIDWLSMHHAMEILLGLGVLLVMIDYFFRTDVPAHFGYACFALAFFFALGLAPLYSLIAAAIAFVVLEVLHAVVFSRFLNNAPGKEKPAKS